MTINNLSRNWIGPTVAFVLLVYAAFSRTIAGVPATLADVFLKRSGIWEGPFTNYVNKDGGIVQKGIIRYDVRTGDDQIVRWRINFIDPAGKESGYTGYSIMKINGPKLEWVGEETADENTKNRIEGHVFKGYLLDDHLYIYEAYAEVFPDGKREKRRNDLHFVLLKDGGILLAADVFVDNELLVFAQTTLRPLGLGNPKITRPADKVIAVTDLYHSAGQGFGVNAGIIFTINNIVFIDSGMTTAPAE